MGGSISSKTNWSTTYYMVRINCYKELSMEAYPEN